MNLSRIESLFQRRAQLDRIRAEAVFGFDEMSDELDRLPMGGRVLEVGCGTGYLLAKVAGVFPDLVFAGLEPVGKGFAQFEPILNAVSKSLQNIAIYRDPIESFELPAGESGFDLVFSVNVFEHLDDWRKGVSAASALLAPGGKLVILCPNYAFPYEPHFGLPLLFGPSATRVLFARQIERIEQEIDAAGLWDSLNFISVPTLRRHCRSAGQLVGFDPNVVSRMVARLGSDAEFAARHGLLTKMLSGPASVSVSRLFSRLPTSCLPYMKASVIAAADHQGQPGRRDSVPV